MSNGGEYDVEGVTTSPVTETHIHKPITYYKRADSSFYTRDTTGKYIKEDAQAYKKLRPTCMKPAAYHYPNAHPDLEAFPKCLLPPTPACHGQAPISRKRKSPPSTLSPETTVVLKQTKAAPSDS
ncbi:hypothetical protein K443DRAFT_14399 [Laccaria amethystina LaAM-08-1]|uniref:Uncharacterized protein n=1 Tax=Laccaria amethystina LaAM-08-1 TaxID=1095629 RepID=A0A0C9WT89_9AGAR|nr:hypothetical protein K443DRAFT_14399 [Laccaria amethystina LaAM-08-1]